MQAAAQLGAVVMSTALIMVLPMSAFPMSSLPMGMTPMNVTPTNVTSIPEAES
jgi:hypothetical protein